MSWTKFLGLATCAALFGGVAIATNGCSSSSGGGAAPGDGGVASGDDGSSDGQPAGESSPPPIAVPLEACPGPFYTAKVTIGSQTFRLLTDTGSTTLAVASNKCTNCNVNPLYTPGATAVDQKRTATSRYGNSSWTGEVYQDSVGFASDPTIPLKFGAITTQTNFFPSYVCGGDFQGIMGLDFASAEIPGTDAFFDQFVAAKGIANVFATELCDTGGTLWLGGYDMTVTTAPPQYTPMLMGGDNNNYYAVDLESIAVAGSSTPIPIAPNIPGASGYPSYLDTGSNIVTLPGDAFTRLTTAIARSPGFSRIFGAAAGAPWFSSQVPCGALGTTKAEIDAALPSLTLTFGKNPGKTIEMAASDSYLVPYPGLGWCSSLAHALGAALIGSPFLRAQITIFDRANGRIGFAPHTACPGS